MDASLMTIVRGATYRRTITWRGPRLAPNTPGPPRDLTGRSATLIVRPRLDTAPPILTLTSGGGGLILGGEAGTIQIRAGADATAALVVGTKYIWGLKVVSDADPTEVDILFRAAPAEVLASALDVYP